MNTPTLESLKREVANAGYTPSSGCFEDDYRICAFSVESAEATYGHPRFEAHFSKETGWLTMTGKQAQLITKPAVKRPSIQFSAKSRWVIERFRSEAGNMIGTDAFDVTGFAAAWDAFHKEVAQEDQAATWAMTNLETGEKFCEVQF